MKRLFAWFVCLASLLCGALAHAQTYTADTSAATQAAYPWIDISTTGTTVSLTDDAVSGVVPLGFTFTYGASAYTSVMISSNGMLFFITTGGGTTTQYRNSPLPLNGGSSGEPNIDDVMLPLWDDLQPNNVASYVRYRTQGTAPNRVFIVSWLSVPYYCSGGSGGKCSGANQTTTMSATFQVQLYEQGQFVYRYGVVDGSGGTHSAGATQSNSAGASVGYELTNSDYVQFSYHTASVPNNTTILWSRPVTAPGGFNAFDTTTASGAITGNIHTKVAGSAFNLAVVALNTAKTAVATTFTGDVKVELLDASDNGGAVNASTSCRSSWTTAIASTTTTFASADAGRDTVAFNVANSYRDVRVRMSYPATGTPSVVACSTDNFAIRPASFASFTVTDGDWATAGTARSLANATATGGTVHKAGQPFTVRATAVNGAAAPTTNYTGTPVTTVSACSGTACTASFGSLSVSVAAVAGVITDNTATYNDVGAFSMQLNDTSYASVDGSDGSTAAEMTISSPVITVGRFVPDHFDVQLLVTPVLKTFNSTACSTRSFTYVGQPFGYVTAPQATILARNAAGSTTANYSGALWKLATGGTGTVITQTYSPLSPASPGLDVSGATAPSITSNNNGTGVLAGASTDLLKFVRSSSTPLAPFNAAISLAWSVSDTNENGVTGNGNISTTTPLAFASIAFDSGNNFRYGVLKLASAYGSELNNLPVGVEAQYWDGTRFATNAADQCTLLPTGIVAMGNYQRSLAACETGLASATLRLSSGRGFFTLTKPGAGNSGSVDLGLQLGSSASGSTCVGSTATAASAGNLPWLQGKWGTAATYDQNPTARASFGQYKSPLIYLRESF